MKKFLVCFGLCLKIALLVAMLVGCIFIVKFGMELISDVDDTPSTSEQPSRVETDLTVTFEEIYKAYKSNELSAKDSYKDNRYRITAKINGIKTGGLANLAGGATLTMQLKIDNTIVFFYAEFEKDQEETLKQVAVGDTITFDGTCVNAGNWADCEIVK